MSVPNFFRSFALLGGMGVWVIVGISGQAKWGQRHAVEGVRLWGGILYIKGIWFLH